MPKESSSNTSYVVSKPVVAVTIGDRAGHVRFGSRSRGQPFPRAVAGECDAVICMYHDQGLGAFKLLHFTDGVNLTLGLPIIRTSVDHGTAYDIAGKGVADPRSMKQAILLAAKLIGAGGNGGRTLTRRGFCRHGHGRV